jgi:hypothetical protein
MTLLLQPHYKTIPFKKISEVHQIFAKGINWDNNWCFVGTSGVHGSYTKLDDIEEEIKEEGNAYVTILVIHPRLCVMKYGELVVTQEDVDRLRSYVDNTIDAIRSTQYRNTTMDWRNRSPENYEQEYWNQKLK